MSHTAAISGAERSLLDLLGALGTSVQPLIATPRGPLQAAAEQLGVATTDITGTAGSLRLHPLHTPRALAEMATAAWQVRRAAKRHGAELVHANSIRAGVVLALARLPGAATVVHVRDCLPPGRLSSATLRLIAATATTVVANSRYTADSLLSAAPNARVEVVHNPVDLERFNPQTVDGAGFRRDLGDARGRRLLLGVIAQLSPWKGQETAIEALRLLAAEGLDAQLLIVGSAKFVARSTRFDNEAYVRHLRELVARGGLEDRVSWLGEREDVPEIISALDVLLLPSWEEPFGRAVIEAMALGVPVIATTVGGPSEIITDGVDGMLVAPREPAAWARAISMLVRDAALRARIGAAGKLRVAEAFGSGRHASAMLSVYERAIARSRGPRGS